MHKMLNLNLMRILFRLTIKINSCPVRHTDFCFNYVHLFHNLDHFLTDEHG